MSDSLTTASKQVYQDYDTHLRPRWFSVFFLLQENHASTLTELARLMDQTHPSISRTLREMTEAGLVKEFPDPEDGRKSNYRLTDKGLITAQKLQPQIQDVHTTIQRLREESQHDLWAALSEWDELLAEQNFLQRMKKARRNRLRSQIKIVDFAPELGPAFKDLNIEWIQQFFTVEPADLVALDNPKTYILDKGGYIFFATLQGEVIGTCAMIKLDHPQYDYELAKMAVSPKAQGLGIGFLLGQRILDKAAELGAKQVYLESNTKLTPAISLYRKLGFKEVAGAPSPYARCDIQMAVSVNP